MTFSTQAGFTALTKACLSHQWNMVQNLLKYEGINVQKSDKVSVTWNCTGDTKLSE